MGIDIRIDGSDLVVEMTGADVVWALKRRVGVPLEAVVDVHVEPAPRRLPLGMRFPGAWVPGVLTAGTFYGKLGKSFVDFRRGPAVAIELFGARFDRIVVQVRDAQSVATRLRGELESARSA